MPDGINRLLTREDLGRLGGMSLGSRFTVEGALQGAHRSLLKGFSLEFSDYRQYVAGDDLRRLDWRVFGRNERLYIRQYEQECNLRVHLLVDASRSMSYTYDERLSKYAFAAKLAAGLAYITTRQQDSAGLTLFDSKIRSRLPPGAGAEHLRVLANQLADHQPAAETDIALTLHGLAEKLQRRALVVVMSDLFDDLNRIRQALAHFRRRKHDVILYHVLDPTEVKFPFHGSLVFEDAESGDKIMVNPGDIRREYLESIDAFLAECRQMCAGLDVDYSLVTTDQGPSTFLRQHLARRQRRNR